MKIFVPKHCEDESEDELDVRGRVEWVITNFQKRLERIEDPNAKVRRTYIQEILQDLNRLRPMLFRYFWSERKPEVEQACNEFFSRFDQKLANLKNVMEISVNNFNLLFDDINKASSKTMDIVLLDKELTTQEKGDIIERITTFRTEASAQVSSANEFLREIKRVFVGVKNKTYHDLNMLELRTYIKDLIRQFENANQSMIA